LSYTRTFSIASSSNVSSGERHCLWAIVSTAILASDSTNSQSAIQFSLTPGSRTAIPITSCMPTQNNILSLEDAQVHLPNVLQTQHHWIKPYSQYFCEQKWYLDENPVWCLRSLSNQRSLSKLTLLCVEQRSSNNG
jgi:hypothetical protein